MYYASRTAGVFAVLTLFAAIWFSVRLSLADSSFRLGTPEGVERALEIMPRNTEYLVLRAGQQDYEGKDTTLLLERDAALAPYSSVPRIRLGLNAELRGDYPAAEKFLLEAAAVDRQFEPRWTLANFYFRRQNAEQFWKWIRSALEFSYGDRRLAFEMCWRMSSNPVEILARAIPDRHEVIAAYLVYLLDSKRFDAAGPVSLKLGSEDRPLLLAACDAFIEAGDGVDARGVWNEMGFPGDGIVNPNFERPRIGRCFDWRMIESPGVRHLPLDPYGNRIVMSGSEAESGELLRQYLTLKPGSYVLSWESRTNGITAPTGLEWRAGDQHAALAPTQDWIRGEMQFKVSAPIAPLTMTYERPQGQTRAEGSVELRAIAVKESQ